MNLRYDVKHMSNSETPLFKTRYAGISVKVFSNRVEFEILKSGVKSIPINQIASVELGMFGMYQIAIETTGGKKYKIATSKKKQLQQAIYQAQNNAPQAQNTSAPQASVSDEILKLHQLKEQGIISESDFNNQKQRLLDN